jgi:hypothetical protein
VVLGLAASAFYWVTMVAELKWMRGNKINPDLWYDYRYNFLFGKMVEGSTTWWATVLAFATLLMALPALVLLRKTSAMVNLTPVPAFTNSGDDLQAARCDTDEKKSTPVKALSVLTILAFFMMLPPSRPVWDVVPFLKEVQFPWRWLTVASMLGALLGAASLPSLREMAKTKWRPVALLAAGCFVIAISLTMFQVIRGATFFPRSTFDTWLQPLATSTSLPDWLPIWASREPPAMTGEVEAAGREVTVASWQGQQRTFHLGAGQATEARVRSYYYPHWQATASGKVLATRPDGDGVLVIAVPAEAATIDLRFREPRRGAITNAISVLAWIFIVASLLILRFKRTSPTSNTEIVEPELLTNRVS